LICRGFSGLRALKDLAAKRFVRGIVLHLDDAAVPFGDRLEAVPAAALWPAWRPTGRAAHAAVDRAGAHGLARLHGQAALWYRPRLLRV
jgi:hypothetical protein